MCKNPYIKDTVPFGCGQCLPCRVNKRREWTSRIMLESLCHEGNAFVTLTYNDENVGDYQLRPQHLKDWQKRLRYHTDLPLRFYSVGEYGEQTQRPHYHAVVFGFKGCASLNHKCDCIYCKTLRASWTKGHVLNGTLTQDSAQYVAGYVTKKMTMSEQKLIEKVERLKHKNKGGKYDEAIKQTLIQIDNLNGRNPEFARMSLKPGIGAPALPTIRDMLWTDHGSELMHENGDVPGTIKIGGTTVLLGSYLREKLRKEVGLDETIKEKAMQKMRQERIQEYLAYREEADPTTALSQKEFLIEKHLQKVRNLEKRYKRKGVKGEM